MVSLTETAYFARKGVNISIILLIVAITLKIALGITGGLISKFFPKPPPVATCLFGELPMPNSQNEIATPSGLVFSQEIVDIPAIPSTLKVYFIPQESSSFGSITKMKALAAKLGFTDAPQQVSGTLWSFTDPKNPLKTLEIDEVSQNFHLIYNYGSDLSLFNQKNFVSQEAVIGTAINFFSSAGLLSDDLKNGTPSATYLKIDNNKFVPTTSLANADAVRVSLNRAAPDNLPVLSPDLKSGLVSVTISANPDQTKKIVDAKYYYHKISSENSATYPAVKPSEMLANLNPSSVFLSSIPSESSNTFTVRTVSIAYLDPFPAQPFLQPIYVLSDGKGFTGYVPAVKPNCTKK